MQDQQREPERSRLGKPATFLLALIVATLTVKAAMAKPAVADPICRFIHFYQETSNTGVPMSIWDRLLASLILSQQPHSCDSDSEC